MIRSLATKDAQAKILGAGPENDKDMSGGVVQAVIDMHGHSKKKNIFIYGPYYQIHHENYLKMRVIPKLLSDFTPMFRYFSCKFRVSQSKLKTARIVLHKEFGLMNSFTLEASFHGFI